jgi:DNA invertase Pin-like site-specific DNA recombinase
MNIGQKRVVAYVRVSTTDQSTELQRREIEDYCRARGWAIPAFYEDKKSGTSTDRPSFKQLIEECRARKVDLLLVWKLDRFARSMKDLVNTLQEFSELGIEFISLKDQIDMTTSTGRLMTNIIGAFAQFECDLIKSRVNAGLANAKAKGVRLGRPRVIDLYQVKKLRRDGCSLSQIAKRLSVTKSAVSKILSKHGDPNRLKNIDRARLIELLTTVEKSKGLETQSQ